MCDTFDCVAIMTLEWIFNLKDLNGIVDEEAEEGIRTKRDIIAFKVFNFKWENFNLTISFNGN